MIVDAQVSTGLASAALAVAITQLVASSPNRPITGHQYAERAAEILDKTREILSGPKGAALPPSLSSNYWQHLLALQSERHRLQETCDSIIQSLFNIPDGRSVRKRSQELLNTVETSSDLAFAERCWNQALEEAMVLQMNHPLTFGEPFSTPEPATEPALAYPPTAYRQA